MSGTKSVEPKPASILRHVKRAAWNAGYLACLNDVAGTHDRIHIEHPTINPYGSDTDDAPVRG